MNHKQREEYEKAYKAWFQSLPPEERQKLNEAGLDKPLPDEEKSHGIATAGNGFSFEGKGGVSDPSPLKLAALAENSQDIEIITNHTPFDSLLDLDEKQLAIRESEETQIRMETASGMLSYFFKPKANGGCPDPFTVLCRLYAFTYVCRPHLLREWDTLEKIGSIFGKSKQAISKEVLKMRNHGLIARQGKGVFAVSKYREGTLKYWAEKEAAEKKEKRKQYLKEYRARNREKKKVADKAYYEKNRQRLLREQRNKRKKDKDK